MRTKKQILVNNLTIYLIISGVFRPDHWNQSNQPTLQMGRDSTMTSSDGPLGDPSSWLLCQEQDIEAL